MLAYVKYDDNFKCILPVHLVKGFAPKGEEDFDPSKKIQAFWISEDRKVEGFYPGFVHALADSLVSMRTKIQSMREPFPRILQAEVPKMGKKKAVPTAKEAKKRKLEASSTLHRHILEDFNTSQNASPSKSRDRAVSELKAALDLSEKALKRERDEKEEAQKEVKRLAEELEEAKAINERLTVALLDKIEIARDEARKLRPDPRGEVIAEFILPPPPGAANGDGPGQDLVGQYPEDDCIIPGYQGPAATSEDREVADQDDDIIPADQLPAEMAEECEVADWNDAVIPGGQLPAATAEQQKAVGVPATSARPVPPATVARPQWQRVVPPGPVVSTFLVADGQVQIGPELTMPEPKWHWILRGTTDGKFTLDLARHLWSQEEAAERSLTGQACRSMTGAAQKVTASPVKVEVVKNCLAKYVELHPLPEPPADVRVKNARKYLRNFFTEAGRQGKRVRLPKNAQKNKPVE